jgi:hypothetical protein
MGINSDVLREVVMTKTTMVSILTNLTAITGDTLDLKEMKAPEMEVALVEQSAKAAKVFETLKTKPDTKPTKQDPKRLAEEVLNMITRPGDTPEGVAKVSQHLCANDDPKSYQIWFQKDTYLGEDHHAWCYTTLANISNRFRKLGHKTHFEKNGYLVVDKK